MNTIQEFSTFKSTREQVVTILRTLAVKFDGHVEDQNGKATGVLQEATGITVSGGAFINRLKEMQEHGWVMLDTRGRRTYSITIVAMPDDMPENTPAVFIDTPKDADWLHPCEPATPDEELAAEVEQEVLHGRPGRVAARLERTIPDIIDQAILRSFQTVIGNIAEAFGVVTETVIEDVVLESRVEQLEAEVVALRNELVFEQASGAEARRERNELREQLTRNAAPASALGPHDLAEMYRPLARQAIGEGWRIEPTGGDHIVFISPMGRKVFASKTPGSKRVIRHTRADMERLGLSKP